MDSNPRTLFIADAKHLAEVIEKINKGEITPEGPRTLPPVDGLFYGIGGLPIGKPSQAKIFPDANLKRDPFIIKSGQQEVKGSLGRRVEIDGNADPQKMFGPPCDTLKSETVVCLHGACGKSFTLYWQETTVDGQTVYKPYEKAQWTSAPFKRTSSCPHCLKESTYTIAL